MRSLVALAVSCVLVPFSGPVTADSFVGPVFGIATAPNGDILAVDAAAGISKFDHGKITVNSTFAGANDLSPIGRSSWWVVRGSAGEGTQDEDSGQSIWRISRGSSRQLANLWDFEAANNPAGGPVESNPFDVEALGGEYALVADAAGNDLLLVDDDGHVSVVAYFHGGLVSTANLKALAGCPGSGAPFCGLPAMLPAEPVPTSVTVGPDGYYYVGELRGFPGPKDASRIWRIAPGASSAECGGPVPDPDCELVFDGGFTSIIDLAFGPDGLLYVVELDESAWIAIALFDAPTGGTVNACDVVDLTCGEVASSLPLPTAITFGKDGTLWSTMFGLVPGGAATVIEIP